jgi:hypothetical protein
MPVSTLGADPERTSRRSSECTPVRRVRRRSRSVPCELEAPWNRDWRTLQSSSEERRRFIGCGSHSGFGGRQARCDVQRSDWRVLQSSSEERRGFAGFLRLACGSLQPRSARELEARRVLLSRDWSDSPVEPGSEQRRSRSGWVRRRGGSVWRHRPQCSPRPGLESSPVDPGERPRMGHPDRLCPSTGSGASSMGWVRVVTPSFGHWRVRQSTQEERLECRRCVSSAPAPLGSPRDSSWAADGRTRALGTVDWRVLQPTEEPRRERDDRRERGGQPRGGTGRNVPISPASRDGVVRRLRPGSKGARSRPAAAVRARDSPAGRVLAAAGRKDADEREGTGRSEGLAPDWRPGSTANGAPGGT